MSRPTPTFYVLQGDDTFASEAERDRLRAAMRAIDEAGLNIASLDGTQADAAEAVAAVSAMPFLADRRMVVVHNMLAHIVRKGAGETGKRQLERLLEALPTLPDHARLVFWEGAALRADHKVLRLAESHPRGFTRAFSPPRDATQWLLARAQDEYGVGMVPKAAAALASVVGGDLRRADGELLKLAAYVDGARPITEQDVAALTPYLPEGDLFAMVDALVEGRGGQAMRLLHELLADPNEDPFRVWGMVVRQFRLLLMAKAHLAAGGSVDGLASVLGVSPFAARKMPAMVRAFTQAELDTVYHRLLDYDVMMKTGRISAETALDVLVIGLARQN